jgi:hypothetical protein
MQYYMAGHHAGDGGAGLHKKVLELIHAAARAAGNVGDPSGQMKRTIAYIRHSWPFFNRSSGADHFVWLPGDFGACGVNEQVSLAC